MKSCLTIIMMMLFYGFYLVGCAGNGHGQNDTEARTISPNPQPFVAGKVLFENNCAVCHGNDGTAGIAGAANLQLGKGAVVTLVQTISAGHNGMPAFKGRLSEKEIKAVANYVHSLQH